MMKTSTNTHTEHGHFYMNDPCMIVKGLALNYELKEILSDKLKKRFEPLITKRKSLLKTIREFNKKVQLKRYTCQTVSNNQHHQDKKFWSWECDFTNRGVWCHTCMNDVPLYCDTCGELLPITEFTIAHEDSGFEGNISCNECQLGFELEE